MNGYEHGGPGMGSEGWRASEGVGGDGRGPAGTIAHINDISVVAQGRVDEMKHFSIGHLVEEAQKSLTSARILLEGRRPDRAYLDYLIALEIIANQIPQHKDYVDFQGNRGEKHRQNRELVKEVHSFEDRFSKVRDIIINDNKRSNVQPKYAYSPQPSSRDAQHRPMTLTSQNPRYSMPDGPVKGIRDSELMLPPRASLDSTGELSTGRVSPSSLSGSPRSRPSMQPKPRRLHGWSVTPTGMPTNEAPPVDVLVERFAKLRPTPPINTDPRGSAGDLSVKMPSPTDFHLSSRPLGPRDIPLPPPVPPPHPPKLPLNTQITAPMPKEPSPTYSPARNLSTPASIPPPRSTARSIVGTGGRSNSMAVSSVSSHPPSTNGETDSYFTNSSNTSQTTASSRRKSVHMPLELQISAEKLFDYIGMYNILLIDVRSREEFDEGHIYVNSIICVEPTALEDGYSAEQLKDRLVLSPDEEQSMFNRRDRYDLVVYYDQSTTSIDFRSKPNRNGSEVALQRLFDTLYEFNSEKPLQRPPILLMGGIDAWTGLLGSTSLITSTTAVAYAAEYAKPSRAIRRVPVASNAARLNLQRRRFRDYAPMDAEEERKWLEEARRERPMLEGENEDVSPIYRTTEDFLLRYPDPSEIEQQSMVYPPSRPPVPNAYVAPAIPSAPSRPPPSVPRMSYGGVHERQIAPHGRTSQLPAYVSPNHHPQNRLPRTGLVNFGVTCYMNSTIQCLNATIPLTGIFLRNQYLKEIQRDNWKGSKGLMSENYATLIQNLWKNDVASIRPSSLRRLCARFNSEWGIDRQQDAKEFLEFLLDLLHEDLNTTWAKPPLRELTAADEQARERLPRAYAAKVEWSRYTHREKSVIGNLFAGQHASRLHCTTCGNTSTTYEAFWSISVEIPRDRPADLRECLSSYCSSERLSGDEVWRCPRCRVEREATKKITITRAPEFLVVHFKRFSASHTERARKVRTPIEFPLQGLDLGPFVLPPTTQEDEDYIIAYAKDGPVQLEALKADPAMNGPYIYNAYAVMRHIGSTLSSGHYIAMVKDKFRGCWRQFNDERVIDFDPANLGRNDRLQNEQAYIVFYERERASGGGY